MAGDTDDATAPSLDVVSDEVERVLIEQRKRADGIDTKCGLALAFAGALVAVTRGDARLLMICGRIVAATAGVLALTVVFPWSEPEPIRPRRLLRHLESDAVTTQGFLLMFKGRYHEAFRILIKWKRWGLRLTLVVLAVSITLLTLGVTLSKLRGGGA